MIKVKPFLMIRKIWWHKPRRFWPSWGTVAMTDPYGENRETNSFHWGGNTYLTPCSILHIIIIPMIYRTW